VAKIFVVDDDEQLLRLLGTMLERGGHEPVLLSEPLKAIAGILSEKPDLVIVDVMMPGLSGHELCQQLRANQETAQLPILVLTARAQSVDRQAALKSGADDYISKPVTPQELMVSVNHLLQVTANRSQPPGAGLVISFFSLRGGVGQTTLAVNFAGALRRAIQAEICLVDLSPSGSQAAIHMRLKPAASWADLPSPLNLDWDSLRSLLQVHQSGLLLLPAPAVPQSVTTPAAELVTAVLNLLRENAAVTVLDLPSVMSPAVLAAVSQSDVFIQVVAPEVVSAQLSMQTAKSLQQSLAPVKQKLLVLNQHSPEAQLPQAAVERGLNVRFSFQVGYDSNQSRALAQGIPLSLTSAQSPLPVAVRRMAEAIWQRVRQPA
jgi:pilus assembly protein CpaE